MKNKRKSGSNNATADNITTDLPDSARDKKALEPDEAIIDLPDVEDIPGQEHIHVPPLGELADTTISSADEEGEGLFNDDEDDDDNDDITTPAKTLKNKKAATRLENTDDNVLIDNNAAQDNKDDMDDDEFFDEDEDEEEDIDDEEEFKGENYNPVNSDADVSEMEKELLEEAADTMPAKDELNLKAAALDNTDFDNVPLNEESFSKDFSGEDLDIANTEDDDEDEDIGEEDEENNLYSLGGDEQNSEEEEDSL